MNNQQSITLGNHRPVYLWAGPGTIRMNQLKFMGAPVDEAVHMQAHTADGATKMHAAGMNWAYLMYDWGFPPEVEQTDRDSFQQAVHVYQDADIKVFGYIQSSNCVFDGSYRSKDWYARDPQGRQIYYYTGRYMTCWLHPDWIDHLREMVRGVIATGADGVFFDNPWFGAQLIHFQGAWMGSAGCSCPLCKEAFRKETGMSIPRHIQPAHDPASQAYIHWRAAQVTRVLAELSAYARSLKPDVVISVNNFDAVMIPSKLIYGIDLAKMAPAQDLLMIEDFCLPRWNPDETPVLVNNAITLRTALALAGSTPVTTDPYDKGIGFDDVYSPRRFEQGMAEAAACGVPMVVKGTEFVEHGRFTLLTAEQYAPQREAIGALNHWLEEHQSLFTDRQNIAGVGIFHPGEALWQRWDQLAPLYFAIGQTLLAAGIPWRVAVSEEHVRGLHTLLTVDDLPAGLDIPEHVRVVKVTDIPGWERPQMPFLQRAPRYHRIYSGVVANIFRAYFASRLARKLLDGMGASRLILQSPFFRLPSSEKRQTLTAALGRLPGFQVQSSAPVLVEHWKQGNQEQIHLVNYNAEAQMVTLNFNASHHGCVLMPSKADMTFDGPTLSLELDVYAVVLLDLPDEHASLT